MLVSKYLAASYTAPPSGPVTTIIQPAYGGFVPFAALRTSSTTKRLWMMSDSEYKLAYTDDLSTIGGYQNYSSQAPLGHLAGLTRGSFPGDFYTGVAWNPANSWMFDGVSVQKASPLQVPNTMVYCATDGVKVIAARYNNSTIYTTTDGLNWSTSSLPSVSNWSYIVYTGTHWLCFPWGHPNFARSTDGVTWESIPKIEGFNCRFGGNVGSTILASEIGYNTAARSTNNGLTWNVVTLPISLSSMTLWSTGNHFICNNGGSSFWYSATGADESWSQFMLPEDVVIQSGGYGFAWGSIDKAAFYTADGRVVICDLGPVST